MGFWTGMANATKDRADRNERQDARDQDQAYRDKMFEYTVAQDKLATKRQTKLDGIAAEDLRYNRGAQEDALELTASNRTVDLQIKIMELNPDLAVSLGGGGTPTAGSGRGGTSGSKGSPYVPSSAEQIQSVDFLTQQLGGVEGIKNLKGASKVLFDAALSNPAAAYTLHMFQQAQLKAGNDMAIEDLPTYFEIASEVAAKGQDAMDAFYESGGLEGITDNESFIKGFAALVGFKPAGLNLNQIAPVISEDDQMRTASMVRELDKVKTAELIADRMNELRDSGVTTGPLFELYKQITSTDPNVVAAGRAKLRSEYPDLVHSGGLKGGVGSASNTGTVTQGEGSSGGNAPVPMPTFTTTKEANIFSKSNPEYVGKVNINGKVFDMDGTAAGPVENTTMGQTNPPAMGEPTRGGPGFDVGTPLRSDSSGLLPEQLTALDSAILDNPELESVASSLGAGESTKEALGSLLSYIPRLGTVAGSAAVGGSGYVLKGLSQVQGFIAGLTDDGLRAAGAGALNKQGQDLLDQGNDMFFNGFFQGLDQGEPDAKDAIDRQELIDRMNSNSRPLDTLMLLSSSNKNTNPAVLRELIGDFDKRHGEGAAQAEIDRESASTQSLGEEQKVVPVIEEVDQDKSLTDSQALYDILESGMSQDVIDEAVIAFEKDYGVGSADAAYEMITSRQ